MALGIRVVESLDEYNLRQGVVNLWSKVWENVAAGVSQNVWIQTHSDLNYELHTYLQIRATGALYTQFWEAVRGVSGGTVIARVNLRRTLDGTTDSTTAVRFDVTQTGSKGLMIYETIIPASTAFAAGGSEIITPAWRLLRGEAYFLELKNISANAADIAIEIRNIREADYNRVQI